MMKKVHAIIIFALYTVIYIVIKGALYGIFCIAFMFIL